MNLYRAGCIILILAAAGCASPPVAEPVRSQAPSTAVADEIEGKEKREIVCENVAKTGSHYTSKVCRYADEIAEERELTQDQMRRQTNRVPGRAGR